MSFGVPDLLDGVEVTTLAVAMFAIGETLFVAAQGKRAPATVEPVRGSLWMNARDWARSWKPWLRGTVIGFPIGAMPAGGAEIGTFFSYALEKRLSKHKEEFGNGAIEGVAGPEAANNASAAGTLVPLLTLGLPTSATAAIMLAGFQQYGLQPGPLLFASNPQLVWGLIASPAHRQRRCWWCSTCRWSACGCASSPSPKQWLYAGILLFATLGTIGANPLGGRTRHAAGVRPHGLRRCGSSTSPSRRWSSA